MQFRREASVSLQAHQWTCKNCSNGYDLAAIEAQLVRAVRLKARAYQLQDLRCTKCRQVCLIFEPSAIPLHVVSVARTRQKFADMAVRHACRTLVFARWPYGRVAIDRSRPGHLLTRRTLQNAESFTGDHSP